MKKNFIISLLLMIGSIGAVYAASSKIEDYQELADPKPHDSQEIWDKAVRSPQLGWGSIDIRYAKHNVPEVNKSKRLDLTAWKGEKVNAQALLWTNVQLDSVNVELSDLKCGSSVIPASDLSAHFVRYVYGDQLNPGGGGCGYRDNKAEWDSLLVADVLDIIPARNVEPRSVQPIWLKINVPTSVKAGKYKGTLTVDAEGIKPMSLQLDVNVIDRTLPAPKDWALNLDLWQNPYAVARYYDVPLWSEEHFEKLRPLMKMLADVGQSAITASIMHKPWNAQTEDHYDSMITRVKKIDGTWAYDYAVFDKWVDFMLNDVGIDGLITCYTMIPWSLKFDYYDEATNRVKFVEASPGDEAYAEYWLPFLKDFSKHLRDKGWFDRTAISMDERPMEAMRQAIKLIKEADPEFKITLAGNYHPEIQEDLYCLTIPYGQKFPEDVKAERRSKGQLSCVYTCCTESFPNIFTFSDPAEAVWTALHTVAEDYDGYLRWAVNSWTADPLRDSRFRLFASGDTYNIYPGPRSSIRFERLAEGLQMCEKINVLRKEFETAGDTNKLNRLNDAISIFTIEGYEKNPQPAADSVREVSILLNSL